MDYNDTMAKVLFQDSGDALGRQGRGARPGISEFPNIDSTVPQEYDSVIPWRFRMTVKTTLSFTDRHHRFLLEKVNEGIFATQSAAVAAALEQMIQDEAEREVALAALSEEIRARSHTPRSEFVDQEQAFSASRATIGAARKA